MKAIVFGATKSALDIIRSLKKKIDIVAFCDNDTNKIGGEIDGKPVISPDSLSSYEWDKIYIISFSAMHPIREQLLRLGIPEEKIDTSVVEYNIRARETFVADFARLTGERNIRGAVAEVGVFQGEFAKTINACFPESRCYLFDTFSGFDERDVRYEKENRYSPADVGNLSGTSVELVMSKMTHADRVVIREGFFPETAQGIDDRFVFVNLDLDLYKPTLEGLKFFYPRMVPGGITLVHDYLSKGYEGVNAAVHEFEQEHTVYPFPIADGWSIAIQKV